MPANHFGDLADRPLRQPASRFKRQRLGPKTELKHDLIRMRSRAVRKASLT